MPIERVGSIATTASSSAGTTAVVDLPADIPANSRLIVAVATNVGTTVSTPAGWANVSSAVDGGVRLATYYNTTATPTGGDTLSFTLGASSDWTGIAACYTGAVWAGTTTFGNVGNITDSGISTETGTDTATTSTTIWQGYPGAGKKRIAFAAVRHATTGFSSITASTGSMAKEAEVVSSGATPVTLAVAEDPDDPPIGTFTVTATSNASSAERVVAVISPRPATGAWPYNISATGASSSTSAGTSGVLTLQTGWSDRPLMAIAHFACDNSATFTVPSPWVEVHSTLTGALRLQTYICQIQPDVDTTVDFTLSASANWTTASSYIADAPANVDPTVGGGFFKDWAVTADTVNDAAIAGASLVTDDYLQIPYTFGVATGTSQSLSNITLASSVSRVASITALGTSSGNPRLAAQTHMAVSYVNTGTTVTWTHTWGASTTQKLQFAALIRSGRQAETRTQSITSTATSRASSW